MTDETWAYFHPEDSKVGDPVWIYKLGEPQHTPPFIKIPEQKRPSRFNGRTLIKPPTWQVK